MLFSAFSFPIAIKLNCPTFLGFISETRITGPWVFYFEVGAGSQMFQMHRGVGRGFVPGTLRMFSSVGFVVRTSSDRRFLARFEGVSNEGNQRENCMNVNEKL